MLNRIKKFPTPVSDEQILSAIGAWMLACSVGAQNNTLGMGFETWWMCCKTSWIPRVQNELGVTEMRIKFVLKRYAAERTHRTIQDVLDEEEHPSKRKQ